MIELGHHGGSFDRNVGHAWVLDELEGALRAGLSLFLTDHGLTAIEAQPQAALSVLDLELVEPTVLHRHDEGLYDLRHLRLIQR